MRESGHGISKRRDELVDKPGSVVGQSSIWDECHHSPQAAYPNPNAGAHTGFLFGLAPSGVYLATIVTSRTVCSYHTISPLPQSRGGILSAALAVDSRPPGVTWHSCPVEPGLSSSPRGRSDCLTSSRDSIYLSHRQSHSTLALIFTTPIFIRNLAHFI